MSVCIGTCNKTMPIAGMCSSCFDDHLHRVVKQSPRRDDAPDEKERLDKLIATDRNAVLEALGLLPEKK